MGPAGIHIQSAPTARRIALTEQTSDSNDWTLVIEGDHEAFARVFDRHSDLVYRFVRRRTGDPSVAEDLTAQVFLEAWRQRSRLTPSGDSMRPWLLEVAANLARRHWRSWTRRGNALRRLPPLGGGADPADEASERVDGERRLAEVRHRIESLPAHQAEVLLLWAWEELDYAEIGAVLGIPIGTVRSRLARARARLRDGTETADRALTRRIERDDRPSAVAKERRAR